MNELEAVVQRAKADIAKKYVYVMMPIPQIQTLIDGLEAAQRSASTFKEERDAARGLLYGSPRFRFNDDGNIERVGDE